MVAAVSPRPASPGEGPDRPQLYVIPGGAGRRGSRRHAGAVYRRRRVVALGLVAGVVVVPWLAVRVVNDSAAGGPLPSRATAAHVWVVHPGDTLWGIAVASGDRGDVRPLVDELSAEVHGQPLQVGERITLP